MTPAIQARDGHKFSTAPTGWSHADMINDNPSHATGIKGYAVIRSREGLLPGLVFIPSAPTDQMKLSF